MKQIARVLAWFHGWCSSARWGKAFKPFPFAYPESCPPCCPAMLTRPVSFRKVQRPWEVKSYGGTASPAECGAQLAVRVHTNSHLRRETRKANVLKLREVEVNVNFG
jgi:hypothetical protein